MRLRNNLLSLMAGAIALVGVSGSALAIPLSDLVGGASIASLDGTITFSNFDAIVTGALSDDLSNYEVTALTTGFRLTGAFLVADGNIGDVVLSFTATAGPGLAITDARLFFNGSFNGGDGVPPGLGAGVTETIFAGGSGDPIANLSVAASSQGFEKLVDTDSFAPQETIDVLKDIALSSFAGGDGSVTHISVVDQTYTVTPEPGTLLLGAMGLVGLAALGRKRAN